MNAQSLKKYSELYKHFDDAAAHSYVLGDAHVEELHIDARNAIGAIIREANHGAWKTLHDARHRMSTAAKAA